MKQPSPVIAEVALIHGAPHKRLKSGRHMEGPHMPGPTCSIPGHHNNSSVDRVPSMELAKFLHAIAPLTLEAGGIRFKSSIRYNLGDWRQSIVIKETTPFSDQKVFMSVLGHWFSTGGTFDTGGTQLECKRDMVWPCVHTHFPVGRRGAIWAAAAQIVSVSPGEVP